MRSRHRDRADPAIADRWRFVHHPRCVSSKALKRLLTVGLLPLIFIAPAQADYQAGMAAYTSGEFDTARKEFMAGAEAGNVDAQVALGILYVRGEGVEKDITTAAEWFDKSAAQGHGQAQHLMGRLHNSGALGVRDIAKTLE